MKKFALIIVLFNFIFSSTSQNFESQVFIEFSEDEANEDADFGDACAVYSNIAVVGAKGEIYNNVSHSGAAYIYNKDTNDNWQLLQRIIPDNTTSNGYSFGSSVSVYQNTIVVGAETYSASQNTLAGAVYVYEKDGNYIIQTQLITSPDISVGDFFGCSVHIDQDYMVIGAKGERLDENGQNQLSSSGAVYVYKKNTSGMWEFNQKIVSNLRRTYSEFGFSVSIHNGRIIIGEPYADEDFNTGQGWHGRAELYELNNANQEWEFEREFTHSNSNLTSTLGFSVDIYNNSIIIGDTALDRAYVYERFNSGNWVEANNVGGFGDLGYSVTISDTFAAIGLPKSGTVPGTNIISGYIYVLKKISPGFWPIHQILQGQSLNLTSSNNLYDLGVSVAIFNETIIAGAKNANESNNALADNSGAVVFYRSETSLGLNLYQNSEYLKVYPNPTQDAFQFNDCERVKKVKVYDNNGKLIKTFLNSNIYDISDLNKGLYLLDITLVNGFSVNAKILKHD